MTTPIVIAVDDPEHDHFVFDAIEAGPIDGELVLLLHGFPETKRSYRHQLPALAAAGYRAVAVDQRGYSPGARPAGVDSYRIDALVRDTIAMADSLGADRFHLVGHDYGAVVAWQVAGRHPDRLWSMTSLSVPHPFAYCEAYETSDQAERSGYFAWFRDPATDTELGDPERLRRLYLAAGLSADDADAYAAALGSPAAIGSALNWYRAAGPEMIFELGPITVPVLYIWSTEDPALGRDAAERTAAHVAGPYRFEVFDGVDHWIPEHAAAETNRILVEFLASDGVRRARARDQATPSVGGTSFTPAEKWTGVRLRP